MRALQGCLIATAARGSESLRSAALAEKRVRRRMPHPGRRYSAASRFDALLATSCIADITSSVAVCWIMWPFPATR